MRFSVLPVIMPQLIIFNTILPIYKQVLLYPEALCASVAVEAVMVSPELRFGLIVVALAL